jgi:hypothetical protein
MADYYDLLGVTPLASSTEIEEAYVRVHGAIVTDGQLDEDARAERLRAVEDAYSVLVDPAQRARYDQGRAPAVTSLQPAAAQPSGALPAPIGRPTLGKQMACPYCGTLNPLQSTLCSQCGQQISRPCPHCGQPTPLGQTVCSRCDTFIPSYDRQRFTDATASQQRIDTERQDGEIRGQALETANAIKTGQGCVIWIVIAVVAVLLLFLLLYLLYLLANPLRPLVGGEARLPGAGRVAALAPYLWSLCGRG